MLAHITDAGLGRHVALVIATSLLVLLSACGGGGVGAEAPDPTSAQFSGTVRDASGNPIAGAGAVITTSSGELYGDVTDGSGRYSFTVPAVALANVSPVALAIFKNGFAPRSILYDDVRGGVRYADSSAFVIATLAANEFAPVSTYTLVHLGDDSFGGSANSQLQARSSGTSHTFEIPASYLERGYTSVQIEGVFRGVQTSIGNPNSIELYQFVNGSITNFKRSSLRDSPPSGGVAAATYTFGLSGYRASAGPLLVAIVSRFDESNPRQDYDDFEFGGVIARFR